MPAIRELEAERREKLQERAVERGEFHDVIVAIFLLIVTILIFWKLALTSQFTWLNSPDQAYQVLPWLQEQARQLRTGHFPVWDRHHWGGYPFPGQSQPGVLFPLNWLLALIPLKDGQLQLQWLNAWFVLIHYPGTLAAWRLCRDRGCSQPASAMGAIFFGLGGWMAYNSWPQMVNGGVLAPLVFLFLLRAFERRPLYNGALAGAMLGISLWSGHHQIPMFVGLAAMVMVVLRRAVLAGGAFGLFALLTGAPQLLTSNEYYSLALRWVGANNPVTIHDKVPYSVFGGFSLNPVQFLYGLTIPIPYGNVSVFAGVVVVALAASAIILRWRRSPEVPLIAAAGGFSLLYAMGVFTPLHGMLYGILPGLDKSRNLAYAVMPLHLCLGLLTAFGWDAWWERAGRIPLLAIRIAGGFGGLLLAATFLFRALQPEKEYDLAPIAMAALFSLTLAGVAEGWRRGALTSRTALACVLGLLVLETGQKTGWQYAHVEQGWPFLAPMLFHNDVGEFVQAHLGQGRVLLDPASVPYNFGDWYGVDQSNGISSATSNILRYNGNPNLQRLMGVRFWLGAKPHREGQTVLMTGRAGIHVYEEPDAFPRAWTVHRILETGPADSEWQARMNLPTEQLRQSTFLAAGMAPSLEQCDASAADSVNLTRFGSTLHVLNVDLRCRGMVVLGNLYFPGWEATVDGKPAPIHEAYGFLQGVVVDGGRHRVQLKYWPGSLMRGVALLGIGLVGILTLRRTRL